jgi:hypothetical protein
MSAAALAGLMGQLGTAGMQLPLGYGQLYQNAYAPGFNYFGQQANNMTNLGQAGMGLYGNLAGQQASMYQAELPHMADMAMFNSLAPALSGILGSAGMGNFNISPMQMQFNRPDVMGGYQGVMDRSYNEAKGYDGLVGGMQADLLDKMPTAPYMQQQQMPQQSAQQAPQQMPRYQSPLDPVKQPDGSYRHRAPGTAPMDAFAKSQPRPPQGQYPVYNTGRPPGYRAS